MGVEWSKLKQFDTEDGKYWYSQADIPVKTAQSIWTLWSMSKGGKFKKNISKCPFAIKKLKGKEGKFVIYFKIDVDDNDIDKETAQEMLDELTAQFKKHIHSLEKIRKAILNFE